MSPTLVLFLLSAAPGVSRVVVYPDRAQVTRVAHLTCGAHASVTFEAIPPAADSATLRALSSTATVEGLRSASRAREDVFGPRVKALDEDIRKRRQEISTLSDTAARADEQARVAHGYADVAASSIDREMAEAAPNTKAWGQALDATLSARLRAVSAGTQVQAQLRQAQRALEDVVRERQRLEASAHRRELSAEVLVSCADGKTADVELTYTVGGASWVPSYEARAQESEGAVDLATYATVRQTTGEDWGHAHVVLSTAIPQENATPPELQPLKVWAEERSDKKVLVRREESVEHAEASTPVSGGRGGGRGMVATSQGVSVQLAVAEPADVRGDGTPARLFVGTTRMQAHFANRTLPKMMPFVFRVADVTNTGPFPLLPGQLDAFRRAGLIGQYPLERVAQGAPFHLTFGIEDALRVKRTVVEEVVRDTGLFGTNHRFRYAYRLELANYGKRAEEVEVDEHVPVSELSDVKVEVDAKTTPGYALRPDDGILVWKPTLNPRDKKTFDLAFHVDVPSSYE
jgi:uncharacterized protein (TIGR02231 family)